jgi:serpin B
MMYQKALFRWGRRDDARFLEMPYVGGELSMVVLLPDAGEGLGGLEEKLNSKFLADLLAAGNSAEVMVYLPRFKLEWKTDLAQVLPAMGMSDAFAGSADFSGMTGAPGLLISNVIHQAMVDVNEEGTEAAAVTVVLMKPASAEPPNIFRADHPFLFLIRDMKTGSVLFIGRVMDPRG